MTLPETPGGVPVGRRIAIGCLMTWLGFVSGAMVAALVSKMAAFMTRSASCAGVPSCNWYIYAMIGGGIGAVSLPVLVLWTLGKPAKGPNPDRGL
ncbi:MAG: hypothetical protein ACHQQ3_12685 [Gemmatimonadales bacterium]